MKFQKTLLLAFATVFAFASAGGVHKINNHYILADSNCKNLYICEQYQSNNDCYKFCHDQNGKERPAICGNYINPFVNQAKCGGSFTSFANYYDNRCFVSPYDSQVVSKCGARKTSGLRSMINGRCLSGAGWCPCTRGRTSSDRCGKVNKDVYVCSSGYCCSSHGYCGDSKAYCGRKCQSEFGKCW